MPFLTPFFFGGVGSQAPKMDYRKNSWFSYSILCTGGPSKGSPQLPKAIRKAPLNQQHSQHKSAPGQPQFHTKSTLNPPNSSLDVSTPCGNPALEKQHRHTDTHTHTPLPSRFTCHMRSEKVRRGWNNSCLERGLWISCSPTYFLGNI